MHNLWPTEIAPNFVSKAIKDYGFLGDVVSLLSMDLVKIRWPIVTMRIMVGGN